MRMETKAVDESVCESPIRGEHFGEQSATWIQCNNCKEWYDMECAGIDKDERALPDQYMCDFCYQ